MGNIILKIRQAHKNEAETKICDEGVLEVRRGTYLKYMPVIVRSFKRRIN